MNIVQLSFGLLVLSALSGSACNKTTDISSPASNVAYSALAELNSAERKFFDGDVDKNGYQDFWTGDVAGLYKFGLVSRQIAEADAAPINRLVEQPIPYQGYYFIALEWDDSGEPPERLKQVTDTSAGKVHHQKRFAFCAYPARSQNANCWTYLRGFGGNMGVVLGRLAKGKFEPVLRWPSMVDRSQWAIIN